MWIQGEMMDYLTLAVFSVDVYVALAYTLRLHSNYSPSLLNNTGTVGRLLSECPSPHREIQVHGSPFP